MKKPEPKKYLNAIKAYKGGLSKIEGVDKIFKLSSNDMIQTQKIILIKLKIKNTLQ